MIAPSASRPSAPTPTPRSSPRIAFHYTVTGRNLKPDSVERAIKLSYEKYCSATIMLGKTAEIEHTWEIVEV